MNLTKISTEIRLKSTSQSLGRKSENIFSGMRMPWVKSSEQKRSFLSYLITLCAMPNALCDSYVKEDSRWVQRK